MGHSTPINISALAARQGLAETAEEIAIQVTAEEDMMAASQDAFNSMAAARAQSRYDRFKALDARRTDKSSSEEVNEAKKVKGVTEKTEEDLAQSFEQRNAELPAPRLRSLKDSLSQEMSEEQLMQEVLKAFADPTLADEALQYLEQATTGPLKDKISIVRKLLNEEKQREIIGGRNIDEVAKDFAARGYGANPSALRDLYRDVTGTERDHNALFDMLARQYPFEQLKEIVAFLLKGMAYDMKSKGPSISHPELMRLLKETRNLQSILWVYLFFKERLKLMRNLYGRYGMTYPEQLSFEKIAKAFMKAVSDRYPSSMKILKEAERLGLLQDVEKVIVLSQFRDAIRGLSPRLYHSVRHKQDLLLALIETLEKLEEDDEEEGNAKEV